MYKIEDIQKVANSFARKNGRGTATKVELSDSIDEPILMKNIRPGYVKNTTGEYVPNAYRAKFGWKNTHYQAAICEVVLPAKWFGVVEPQQIKNINEAYGDPVTFGSFEEYQNAIVACGYQPKELIENVDYERVK